MAWHPFRNPGLKLLALVLGTLLWFTISGYEIERRISVPVTYRNIPTGLELTGEQTERVAVHVRGDDSVVGTLTEGDLRVTIDLEGAQPGVNPIPLRTDQVVVPARIEVMQVDPGTVTVALERAGQSVVPVRPTIEGRPAQGFLVRSISVEPEQVVIAGPQSRLVEKIDVVTERVVIEGRTGRFTQEVTVGVNNPQLRVHSPRTVRVTVQIEPVTPGTDDSSEGEASPASPSGETQSP